MNKNRDVVGLRVLCAEDDDLLADVLTFALTRAGHLVDRVEDGLKAWERMVASYRSIDVLLTDHRMPGLSGLQLVERVRALGFHRRIIVHSAGLRDDDMTAYRSFGVEHFLNKPVHLVKLLSSVRTTEPAVA